MAHTIIDGSGSVVAFHLAAEYEWKITLARPQFMRVIVRLSENNFMAIYALRALIIGLGIFTDFKACCERLNGEWFYVFGVRSEIQRSKCKSPIRRHARLIIAANFLPFPPSTAALWIGSFFRRNAPLARPFSHRRQPRFVLIKSDVMNYHFHLFPLGRPSAARSHNCAINFGSERSALLEEKHWTRLNPNPSLNRV